MMQSIPTNFIDVAELQSARQSVKKFPTFYGTRIFSALLKTLLLGLP
jgi:hypothetical protein